MLFTYKMFPNILNTIKIHCVCALLVGTGIGQIYILHIHGHNVGVNFDSKSIFMDL